jgi:hypothetical protein
MIHPIDYYTPTLSRAWGVPKSLKTKHIPWCALHHWRFRTELPGFCMEYASVPGLRLHASYWIMPHLMWHIALAPPRPAADSDKCSNTDRDPFRGEVRTHPGYPLFIDTQSSSILLCPAKCR